MDRFFRSAHSGEHASITSRRTFEDSRLTLDNQQSISVKLVEHAAWQKRSNEIVRRNELTRHVHAVRQTESERLQDRRNALRQLIEREEAEHRAEMIDRMETAESRKQRVIEEARRLKADREVRREAQAAEGYSKQWKERCDDLRTLDSQFFARHCAEVVEQQIEDGNNRKAQQRDEERQYAQQWEVSRQDKIKQEDDKVRRRKEAVADNRTALKEQMEVRREMERQQKERQAKEKEIHQHILEMDAAEAKQKAIEEHERKRRQNRENAAFNERLLAARRAAYEQQRTEAREALAVKMEQYRAATEEQHKAMQRHRGEMAEYMAYMDKRREQQIKLDKEMDRLIEEDVKREEDKRDQQWAREKQAREQLMSQVYHGRQQQIRQNEQQRAAEEESKMNDKMQTERDIQLNRQAEAAEERERHRIRTQRRQELREQMALNREKREFEASEREREKQELALEEREHQAKLAAFRQEKMEALQRDYNLTRR